MKQSELVTIGWAHGTSDAYLATSMLTSAGIPVYAESLHITNMNWSWSQAFGGIAIQVPGSQAGDAWEVLADFRGNSTRRWRRWQWFVGAAIVCLWIGLPPPANGYTPSTRWLSPRISAPQPEPE